MNGVRDETKQSGDLIAPVFGRLDETSGGGALARSRFSAPSNSLCAGILKLFPSLRHRLDNRPPLLSSTSTSVRPSLSVAITSYLPPGPCADHHALFTALFLFSAFVTPLRARVGMSNPRVAMR